MHNITGFAVAGRRTHIGKVIVPTVVALLLCVIVTMELPELLTLTNDTTNDFTILRTTTVDSFVLPLSGSHRQITGRNFDSPAPELLSTLLSPVEKPALLSSRLFILHSDLRT